MSAPPSPPMTSVGGSSQAAGWLALAAAGLGMVVLFAAVVQDQFGTLSSREWKLPVEARRVQKDGFAYKVRLPSWGLGSVAAHEVVLLDKGRPAGIRVPHGSTVVNKGLGTYKLQKDYLYFSLEGNEDPRGRLGDLALALPRPVSDWVWLTAAGLLLAGGLGLLRQPQARRLAAQCADRLQALPSGAVVLVVFLASLAVTLSRLPAAMEFSDGCFSVKGVPYSDAAGWDELAVSMAEGRGFQGGFAAQRPLYPAMVSLAYRGTGPSLLAAKTLNAVWLALAAAAVCAIGIRGGSRLAGLAGAMELIFGEDYITFSHLLLTETVGVVFGAAAVLMLALSLSRPAWWRIVLAGLLLACANLASGFGFFALVGYGLVGLVTWWRSQGLWGGLWRAGLLAGTVALAWAPWLVRQQVVHGVSNLSTSSANLMYATATEEGEWSTEVAGEWERAGIKDDHGTRYRYYMEQYARAVKDHPGAYLRKVWRGVTTFFQWWEFHGPEHFGVVLLGLMGSALFLFRRSSVPASAAAAALVLGACLGLHGLSAAWMWPLGTVLVLVMSPPAQRPLWAVTAVAIPFVALLTGMTGGSLGRRMWTCCEWAMPLMLVAGGAGAMRRMAGLLDAWMKRPAAERAGTAAAPTAASADGGLATTTVVISAVLLGHGVLASLMATTLWLAGPGTPSITPVLSPETQAKVAAELKSRYGFLAGVADASPLLWMDPAIFDQYVCELESGENENHWARSFEVRPYARAVAFPRAEGRPELGRFTAQLRAAPADIPRNQPLLVVGVKNFDANAHLGHDILMIEVLGLVPMQTSGSGAVLVPDLSKARWLPATPEAEKAVAAPSAAP